MSNTKPKLTKPPGTRSRNMEIVAVVQYLRTLHRDLQQALDYFDDIINVDTSSGGVVLTSNNFKIMQTVTPSPDGSETVFYTTSGGVVVPYVANTLQVHLDWGVPVKAENVTESDPTSGEFTLGFAPDSDETLKSTFVVAVT